MNGNGWQESRLVKVDNSLPILGVAQIYAMEARRGRRNPGRIQQIKTL
jgi:hypothetical protein